LFPIFKILIFWIPGILLSSLVQVTLGLWVLMFVIFSIFFVSIYHTGGHYHLENGFLICVLLSSVQIYEFADKNDNAIDVLEDGGYVVFLKIVERHKKTSQNYSYIVELKTVFGDSTYLIGKDCLLFQHIDTHSNHYYPGDFLYADVYMNDIVKPKHPALFDSYNYWRLKGITKHLWLKGVPIMKLEQPNNWYDQIRCKQVHWLELLNRQNLTTSTRQILSALLLGDKRNLEKELRAKFSNLGMAHVLALSGLHIGLIYGFFAFFLRFIFKYRPILQSICLVVIIVLYALLTGMSPSVMRASLMFLLHAVSLSLNRRVPSLNIVMFSALVMLIYNSNLLYDLGFQLSYLAVIGILYFYRFFKNYFETISPLKRFILGIAFVTISAQLSTAFLSIYYFHTFPVSFLWANLIVMPIMMLLLYFGFIYLLLLIFDVYTSYISHAMDVTIYLLLQLLAFIERFSFSPVLIFMTRNEVFYFYGLLILICWVFLEKKFKHLQFLYLYVLLGVCCYSFRLDGYKKELFVNASTNALVISVIANNEQVVLTNDVNSLDYLLGDYSLRNSISCLDTLPLRSEYSNAFFGAFGSHMSILNHQLMIVDHQLIRSDLWIDVDVLILQSFREDAYQIKEHLSPEVVLLDASIPNYERLRMKQLFSSQNIQIVDLKEDVYTKRF